MKFPFLACLVALLFGLPAAAQVPDSLAAPVGAAVGAAVVLPPADTLFRVYGRVGSFGPKEQAEAIERRLEGLLKAPLFAPDSLTVVDTEQDSEIVYGDQLLLSIGAAEAQALGQPRPAVAYQINAYTRLPHRQAGLYSLLHQHIQDEFASAGVEIMSPHYRATSTGAEGGSTVPPAPPTPPAQP